MSIAALPKSLHQFTRKDLADRPQFRRRDPVDRSFRAVDHQLTTNLDFCRQAADAVANARIETQGPIGAARASAQHLEGVRDFQHYSAAHQSALVGERVREYLPSAVDLADQSVGGDPDIVVEDIGVDGLIVMPDVFIGTMNMLIPACFGWASGSFARRGTCIFPTTS